MYTHTHTHNTIKVQSGMRRRIMSSFYIINDIFIVLFPSSIALSFCTHIHTAIIIIKLHHTTDVYGKLKINT